MARQGNDRYSNMDIVRYILSISVIIAHFNILLGHELYWPMTSGTAVSLFFGLSGFLVYESYKRCTNFKTYLSKRINRIIPPYFFVIVSSTLFFSLCSSLSLGDYFTSTGTLKYLLANLSFLNFLAPTLPGVFETSNVTAVNASLWTLKVEWMLYLTIPLFFYLVRRFKLNTLYTCIVIIILSTVYRQLMMNCYEHTHREIYHIMSYQFGGQMVFFYSGVIINHLLIHIKNHFHQWFALSVIIMVSSMLVSNINYDNSLINAFLFLTTSVTMVFVTVLICIIPARLPLITKLGNCSYEMYLFHFPVIQIFVFMGLGNNFHPMVSLLINILIIFLLSFCFMKVHNRLKSKRKKV